MKIFYLGSRPFAHWENRIQGRFVDSVLTFIISEGSDRFGGI